MAALLIAVLASLATMGYCGESDADLTVTREAWFEIEISNYDGPGEDYRGRFVIGLFGKTVPMTVMNFGQLTNGFERKKDSGKTGKLHYKNTLIHRVVQDFVIQGGDIENKEGSGGKSMFGDKFIDENFLISHRAAGYVSMANHGKDTNNSQFFVTLNKARWLDDKHVVFGKVVEGMDTVRAIGDVELVKNTSKPKNKIKIVDCGCDELESDKQYRLTPEEADSDEDLVRNN